MPELLLFRIMLLKVFRGYFLFDYEGKVKIAVYVHVQMIRIISLKSLWDHLMLCLPLLIVVHVNMLHRNELSSYFIMFSINKKELFLVNCLYNLYHACFIHTGCSC